MKDDDIATVVTIMKIFAALTAELDITRSSRCSLEQSATKQALQGETGKACAWTATCPTLPTYKARQVFARACGEGEENRWVWKQSSRVGVMLACDNNNK